MNNMFTTPLQVGDKVYTRFVSDGELIQDELTVTEVCSRGFFVSIYNPPKDDLGHFIPYDQLGKTFFLDANTLIERGVEAAKHE